MNKYRTKVVDSFLSVQRQSRLNKMKCILKFKYYSIIVLLLTSWMSEAKLRIAYIDVPPFAFQDERMQPQGLLIEAFNEIANAVSQEPEFIHLPHRRLIDFIERGEVDLWAGQANSQVNDEVALVSNTPLFVMDLQVYWQKGTPSIRSLSDLSGKKLLLISSFSYGGNLLKLRKESESIQFVINHEVGFDALFNSELHYLLGYQRISQSVIDKFAITNIENTSIAKYKLYLKIAKVHPDAKKLMQQIDTFLLTKQSSFN